MARRVGTKSTVTQRLRLAAAKDAALMDDMSEAFARKLADVVGTIQGNIRALASKVLAADENGRLVSDQASIGRAVALRTDLVRAIRNGGYGDLVQSSLGQPWNELAQEVMRTSSIAADAAALTATDEAAIGAVRNQRAGELLSIGNDAADVVSSTILQGVVGAIAKDDLIASLADVLGNSFAQAHTIYDTAVSIFARQVDQIPSDGDPNERFIFVGPVDKKTRKFCLAHVGRVYTRAEVDDLDNGQLPNVMLTGGGYNCRHQWKLVTKFDPEAQWAGGMRDPDVQAQVDAVDQQRAAEQVARDRVARGRNRAQLGLAPLLDQTDAPVAADVTAEQATQAAADAVVEQPPVFVADAELVPVGAFPSAGDEPGSILARAQGSGFTYDPRTGAFPTDGYVVSVEKGRELVISQADFTADALHNYILENWDLLSQEGNYFGGWFNEETGMLNIDVSRIVSDPFQALDMARGANQDAIFRLLPGTEFQQGGYTIVTPQLTPSGEQLLPGFQMPTDQAVIDEAQRQAEIERRASWTIQDYLDAHIANLAAEGTVITEAEAISAFDTFLEDKDLVAGQTGIKTVANILDAQPLPEMQDALDELIGGVEPPKPPLTDAQQAVQDLAGGTVMVDEPLIPDSEPESLGSGTSVESFTTTTTDANGDKTKWIVKPESTQTSAGRTSIDLNNGMPQWQRELLGYRVDQALGTNLVPRTVARAIEVDGNVETASMMEWIEGAFGGGIRNEDEATRVVLLDLITGNTDRHGGNLLRSRETGLIAIDQGLMFPQSGTVRTGSRAIGFGFDGAGELGLQEFRSEGAAFFQGDESATIADEAAWASRIDSIDWNALTTDLDMSIDERETYLSRVAWVSEHLRSGDLLNIVRDSYTDW